MACCCYLSKALGHQPPSHIYQQSLASLSSIRSHLPTSINSDNQKKHDNKSSLITNHSKKSSSSLYLPLYKQPSSAYRSFSTSSSRLSSSSTSLSAASPAFRLPEQEHHILHHHKSLPLLDFFSKAYAKPIPSYIFAHGASGFAKNRHRYTTPDNKAIDKNENYYSTQIGEDAYFRRSDALGVADGVGGWAGVSAANAALYSRKLMHHAYMELERFDNIEDPCFYHYDEADPVSILQRSYEESMQEAQQEGIIGSCTACLAILRHEELRIANIGDCGISVIRHNDYIFRSEEQQHSFNFPYQLGTSSPDRPNDAQSFTVAVEKGDIIIMGSDGLFDNLFDKEILSIVKAQIASSNRPTRFLSIEPQKISDALAERAKYVSKCKLNVDSPFQVRAVNEGLYYQV
ncbi:unnamed protein product [Mucor hiemalis]